MIEEDHLKYFITEEIFLVKENEINSPASSSPEKSTTPEKTVKHEVVVWTHELTDKDQALLQKMLNAVNLDLNSVHLIHHEEDYSDQYKVLLSFGNINFLSEKTEKEIFLNQPVQWEGKNIFVSYPISSLHTDVKKKGELWNGLKKLFRI